MCSFVHFKLFNSYCMSLYGSQLWNYENKSIMDSVYCYIYTYVCVYHISVSRFVSNICIKLCVSMYVFMREQPKCV